MRVTSNTNPYVYEYKKPNETQSRFIDILAEMKPVSGGDNRLDVRLTPSGEPSDESDTWVEKRTYEPGENGLPVGMIRLEDCGVYEMPETPELRESLPLYYDQLLSGYFLGLSGSQVYDRLQTLAQEAASADYSGMSDVEIYDSIQKRYEDAFGKDFLDPTRLGFLTGDNIYCRIEKELSKELKSQFGSEENVMAVNRKRLYGDMSDDEIQDQIRAKYPGKLTNRELFLMLTEMGEFKVIPDPNPFLSAYVRDYCFDFDGGIGTDKSYEYWINSLDEPIRMESIIAQHNAHQISQFPNAHKDAAVLSPVLLKHLDVHLDSKGFMVIGASRTDLISGLFRLY